MTEYEWTLVLVILSSAMTVGIIVFLVPYPPSRRRRVRRNQKREIGASILK